MTPTTYLTQHQQHVIHQISVHDNIVIALAGLCVAIFTYILIMSIRGTRGWRR